MRRFLPHDTYPELFMSPLLRNRLAMPAWAGLLALLVPVAVAEAQAPSLVYMFPHAVVPGQATDLSLYGAALEGAHRLWTSFPGTSELAPGVENNGQAADHVVFRVTVPTDCPAGVTGVRVATGRGVSETRLVLVDPLAATVDSGANKTIATAQEVTLPTAIDGTCEAESFDYYRFSAVAGQHLTAEVIAQRVGSALDPAIRLLDAQGQELAYSDDEPGVGADSRLSYRFGEAGSYLIEVRDIRYQGSAAHRYRLRLGDFPLCSTTYPLGVRQGTTGRLALLGPATGEVWPFAVSASGGSVGQRLVVQTAAGAGVAWVQVASSDLIEAIEFEPNDEPAAASPVDLPAAWNGRLEKPHDRDFFQFTVQAGQRWQFAGQTRTLGSPTDLFLRLYKEDGTLLGEVDDTGPGEGVLDYTFAEAGNYRLMVEDLHRRGGPEQGYRIEVRPYKPGFSLTVETDRLNAPKQGVFVAKVTVARRDYAGPIALAVEGVEGLALAGNVIAENANETVLRATLPAQLEPGQMFPVRVVGRATIGDSPFESVAGNLVALRAQFAGLPQPPAELDGALALGVGPVFGEFLKLTTEPVVMLPQLVGTSSFKVKAEKLNGFDEAIALAIEGLPAGFSAEVKPIDKGQGEVEIAIKGPASSAEGDMPLRVVGTSTFQEQPGRAVADLVLRVVRPIAVTLSPAGPIKAGSTQNVKLTVARFGGATGAVAIEFRNLPAGLSVPAMISVAEGQTELAFDVAAAPDARIGSAGVVLVATTLVGGREVVVMSDPLPIEVVAP